MNNITNTGLVLAAMLCCGTAVNSPAQDVSLFDWGFNIDSTIYTPLVPPSDPLPGFVNTAGFDFATGLGTITATITGPGAHYFSLFVDQEIDEAINTWFNEFGSAVNTPTATQTWEIDEPGYVFGDIYDNFLAGTLDNFNAVPAAAPDDVAMALAWDFTLGAGQTATLTMNIEDSPPPGGFYLVQTDPESQYSLYFSSRLTARGGGGGGGVPDGGSSLGLLALALCGLAVLRRRV